MTSPYESYKDWEHTVFPDESPKSGKPSLFVVLLAGTILLLIIGFFIASVISLTMRSCGWGDVLTFKQEFSIGLGFSSIRAIDMAMFKSRT